MNSATKLEHRASSSRSKHEGEPSIGLCDRLSRTRDNSQRQLPTDHDYAVPTREYQTDQSSLKPAQAAARSVLEKQKQRQKQNHRIAGLTRSLHISPLRSIGALSEFSHRFRTCGLLSDSHLKRGTVVVRPRHPVLRPLRLARHRRLLQILGHLPARLARRWEW